MQEPLIRMESLSVNFRSGSMEIPAVRDVSLSVNRNETLGIVGESGSGKSATALALLRLHNERHTSYRGRILADGKDVFTFDERALRSFRGRIAGIIFQEPMNALNPVMRVGEQIIEPLLTHERMDRTKALALAAERLVRVGITDAASRLTSFPHELSGGMRQRVMIAMATMLAPPLLIADEPTTALDVTVQRQVIELLKELRRTESMSIIIISHDLGVVTDIADRIAVMYLGEIVEYGGTRSIMDEPKHPYTAALVTLARTLARKGNEPLSSIPGSVPSPRERPEGCAFHPRCSRCFDRCRTEHPLLLERDGMSVRCHLYDR
ncbi:MAG: ABC transporter ATP-binding protein [Spirochaetota bacterium]